MGQTAAQAPHSMQAEASITYLPSPSEMAETGHSAEQAPQLMQSSVILYAMVVSPPRNTLACVSMLISYHGYDIIASVN